MQTVLTDTNNNYRREPQSRESKSSQSSEKYPEYSDRCSPKEWANHVLTDLLGIDNSK